MTFAIQKKIILAYCLLLGSWTQLYSMERFAVVSAPVLIIDLPQDIVLYILVAKFNDLLIAGNILKLIEEDPERALAVAEGREKYYTCPLESDWARVKNLTTIKAFMLTNRRWTQWLADRDFTNRFIKIALLFDPLKDGVCFDYLKGYMDYRGSQARILFSNFIYHFRTVGVAKWLKDLFSLKPEVERGFKRFVEYFADTPRFIEAAGLPLTIRDDRGYTLLNHVLGRLNDHPEERSKKIVAARYLLSKVPLDDVTTIKYEVVENNLREALLDRDSLKPQEASLLAVLLEKVTSSEPKQIE